MGLVTKRERDKRTNEYRVTECAESTMVHYQQWEHEVRRRGERAMSELEDEIPDPERTVIAEKAHLLHEQAEFSDNEHENGLSGQIPTSREDSSTVSGGTFTF